MTSTQAYGALAERTPAEEYTSLIHDFNQIVGPLMFAILGIYEVVALVAAILIPLLHYKGVSPVSERPLVGIWVPTVAFVVLHTIIGVIVIVRWHCRRITAQPTVQIV